MVRVYSNCATAELFLNGKSLGTKKRDPEDFPCAGLRWQVAFQAGRNHLKVVAKSASGKTVTDEIDLTYETTKWQKPVQLKLAEIHRDADKVTIEATLHDAAGTPCLDAKTEVRFSLAGPGKLQDNLGTSTGSRLLQMYNGRARITVARNNAPNTASVTAEGLPPAFVNLA